MNAKKARTVLAVTLFLFSFIFIRIYSGKDVFFVMTIGDDAGYYAFTEAFLKTHTLHWCDPGFTYKVTCAPDNYNRYSPGPAILLLPFTALGHILEKAGIYQSPGLDNLRFWSVVGTFFLLLAGAMCLLELAAAVLKNHRLALITTLAFLCGNVVLYYVFRRPLMSHAAEFFLFFAAALLCVKVKENFSQLIPAFLLGFCATFITVVRHNDFSISGFIGLWFLFFLLRQKNKWRSFLSFSLGALIPLIIFFSIFYLETGSFIYNVQNYDEKLGTSMLYRFTLSDVRRFFDFFFGPHWGMFWIMPVLWIELAGIINGFANLKRLLNKYKLLFYGGLALCFIHLSVVAHYANNGFSYGYRYVLPVIYAFHIVFLLALAGLKAEAFLKNRLIVLSITVLVVFQSFNLINFESNATTLTLTDGRLEDEGIYDAVRKNAVELRAPNYAFHSLKHTVTGKALATLGASPMGGYSLFIINSAHEFKSQLWQQALAYYRSDKRQIFGLKDFKVLFQYQLFLAIFLLIGIRWYFFSSIGKRLRRYLQF